MKWIPPRRMAAQFCVFPQTIKTCRHFSLAPLRYADPLATSESEYSPSGFQSHSGACFGNWAKRGSPPLSSPGPTESGRHSDQAHSRKRAGSKPNAPPTQPQSADSQRARDEEDGEFRERLEFPSVASSAFAGLVTQRDSQHATRFPSESWPPNDIACPLGGPNRFI